MIERTIELPWNVASIRKEFPALSQVRKGDRPVVFLDGPAGSQVPQLVIDAMTRYLIRSNANHGGVFFTSQDSDDVLDRAHAAAAGFVNAPSPDLVSFGPNMTTLNLGLSRALARGWKAGDEILVSNLDHDANFTPWVLAARDAGATVRRIAIRQEDCTLDLDDLRSKLSSKTRMVAVTCASNAVGTVTPVAEITRLAHDAGALVCLDAVHYAPHRLIDVQAWDCDFLLCSAYKFFGPHIGILYGKREHLTSLPVYKLRPSPEELPFRWETGTQCHEGIAGVAAAIDYLSLLGTIGVNPPPAKLDRACLRRAYDVIERYEHGLLERLMAGLAELNAVKVFGITNPDRFAERVPTISFTHRKLASLDVAKRLAARGIFVWSGNFYALPLTETLGLGADGLVRVGLLHYNTPEEVDRLLAALREWE